MMDKVKNFVSTNVDTKTVVSVVAASFVLGALVWGLKKTGIGAAKAVADIAK